MSNERLEVLGGLPLFEPLSPDERERLAAGCRMRTFARGAALFREGERADGMHIVLRGVVKVVRFAPDGREMVLHLVRKGNTIGEAAMFQKGTFPASAVAVDDVETLFLPADALFTLVTENPEMALRMLEALSLPHLNFTGVFTHFAVSDENGDPYTQLQFSRFLHAIDRMEQASGHHFAIRHCANSGALTRYPEMYLDMVRPGIALYGVGMTRSGWACGR